MKNLKQPILDNIHSICRIIIAAIFILTAYDKLVNLDAVYAVLTDKEFLFSKYVVVIVFSLCELIFGLFLLVGYKIRYVSFLLAFQLVLLTYSMHGFWSMITHEKIINLQYFLQNIIIIFSLIYIGTSTPDKLSLDNAYIQHAKENKKRKKK